jgi:intracellular septation protein A
VSWFYPALRYSFENFLVPIFFFVAFRLGGAKPAIMIALAVTVGQILFFKIRRMPLSPIFISLSALTLVSGLADLAMTEPRYFKYSPAAQNFFIAMLLSGAIAIKFPVAEWFARGLPKRLQPNLAELPKSYPRNVTVLFIFYFLIKGGVYLYLSYKVDLGELVLLRTVVGPVSFALILLTEHMIRKKKGRPAASP